jgi:hypothetical protein
VLRCDLLSHPKIFDSAAFNELGRNRCILNNPSGESNAICNKFGSTGNVDFESQRQKIVRDWIRKRFEGLSSVAREGIIGQFFP